MGRTLPFDGHKMLSRSELSPEVEDKLNKLRRKFNLLSSYLQLKFYDDPGFPRSILADTSAENHDDQIKVEDDLDEEPPTPSGSHEEVRIVDFDTILTPRRIRKKCITVRTEHNTPPCFVSVRRLDSLNSQDMETRMTSHPVECQNIHRCSKDNKIEDCAFRDPVWEPAEDQEFWSSSDNDENDKDQEKPNNSGKTVHELVDRKGNPKLTCPICEKKYTARSILQHVQSLHKYDYAPEMLRNINQEIKISKFKYFCANNCCGKRLEINHKLQRHIETIQPTTKTLDNKEIKLDSSTMSTENGRVDRKGNPVLQCPFCVKTLTKRSIDFHVRTQHKDQAAKSNFGIRRKRVRRRAEYNACEECSQEFQGSRELKNHMKASHAVLFDKKLQNGEYKSGDDCSAENSTGKSQVTQFPGGSNLAYSFA